MVMTAVRTETEIDLVGRSHRQANAQLRETVAGGERHVILHNVCGQRYLGTDLECPVTVDIHGTPGGDLGSFMKGPMINVFGNAQDAVGNTMDEGRIVIHGHAGDLLGHSTRGGEIFVRDYVGYRAGIHMKAYGEKKPVIVIGETFQDFLGEYMAGGTLVVLGLNLAPGEFHRANFIGTGIHGGAIYLRGNVHDYQLGKEVGIAELDESDWAVLRPLINDYALHFNVDARAIIDRGEFKKLFALSLRPYGRLYAY